MLGTDDAGQRPQAALPLRLGGKGLVHAARQDPQRRGAARIAFDQSRHDVADLAHHPGCDVDVGLGGIGLGNVDDVARIARVSGRQAAAAEPVTQRLRGVGVTDDRHRPDPTTDDAIGGGHPGLPLDAVGHHGGIGGRGEPVHRLVAQTAQVEAGASVGGLHDDIDDEVVVLTFAAADLDHPAGLNGHRRADVDAVRTDRQHQRVRGADQAGKVQCRVEQRDRDWDTRGFGHHDLGAQSARCRLVGVDRPVVGPALDAPGAHQFIDRGRIERGRVAGRAVGLCVAGRAVGLCVGGPGRPGRHASADVCDPVPLCVVHPAGSGGDRHRLPVGEDLDRPRLVQGQRTVEPDVLQAVSTAFGRSCGECRDGDRRRDHLHAGDAAEARVRPTLGHQPCLPQVPGRRACHRRVRAEERAGRRRRDTGVARGGRRDPVVGVQPRGSRERDVRFRAVHGGRGAGGVAGVEMGMEGQGVVVVAGQRGKGVMMGVGEGVIDGVGQHRVRADLDEGAVLDSRGRDRLGESHRVAQVVDPVVGIEDGGAVGRPAAGGDEHRDARRRRPQVGEFGPQIRQDRVDDRVVGSDVHIDAPGQPVLRGHHRDDGVDLLGRTGDHDLAR